MYISVILYYSCLRILSGIPELRIIRICEEIHTIHTTCIGHIIYIYICIYIYIYITILYYCV